MIQNKLPLHPSNKKVQKIYSDYGFVFPVQIINAPLSKVRGEFVLDIDL